MGQPERAGASAPAGPVQWGLPDALIAWFFGLVVSLVASAPLLDARRPDTQQVPALLAALVGQGLGVIVAVAFIARRKGLGSLRRDFGFELRARDIGWLGIGVLVSVAAGWALVPITDLAHHHGSTQEVVRLFERAHGVEVPLFALGVVVLAPIAEELLFRGVLLRALVRRTTPGLAVFATALVFALVHVVGDPGTGYYVPAFLALGLLSGWRAQRTGNLSQSIFLHMGFNLLASILILS
jgi:membrane protease YdiL (CAAX protease family)